MKKRELRKKEEEEKKMKQSIPSGAAQARSKMADGTVPGYNPSLISVEGQEFSFEEVRAAKMGPYEESNNDVGILVYTIYWRSYWRFNGNTVDGSLMSLLHKFCNNSLKLTVVLDMQTDSDDMMMTRTIPSNIITRKPLQPLATSTGTKKPFQYDEQDTFANASSIVAESPMSTKSIPRTSRNGSTPKSVSVAPSPVTASTITMTINSKKAMEEVMAMFSSPVSTPAQPNKSTNSSTGSSLSLSPSPPASPKNDTEALSPFVAKPAKAPTGRFEIFEDPVTTTTTSASKNPNTYFEIYDESVGQQTPLQPASVSHISHASIQEQKDNDPYWDLLDNQENRPPTKRASTTPRSSMTPKSVNTSVHHTPKEEPLFSLKTPTSENKVVKPKKDSLQDLWEDDFFTAPASAAPVLAPIQTTSVETYVVTWRLNYSLHLCHSIGDPCLNVNVTIATLL
jgi:hypothetical protein